MMIFGFSKFVLFVITEAFDQLTQVTEILCYSFLSRLCSFSPRA